MGIHERDKIMDIFYKCNALGNEYIILDPKTFRHKLNPKRIQKICDKKEGIGSDGILFGPVFIKEIPHVTIYNPDGSEAEKSGNGIRIFAKYLCDQNYIDQKTFKIRTKGGTVRVKKNNQKATNFTAAMGTLKLEGQRKVILNDQQYILNIASIGNPHCVIILNKISEELAKKVGPIIEKHKDFPKRTNVQFVKVLDRKNIQMEVWERGAGYTFASGTSSSAATGVCHNLNLCDNKVTVHMPGGKLEVTIEEKKEVTIKGAVSKLEKGTFTSEFIKELLKLK